jgi:hypothetical protein
VPSEAKAINSNAFGNCKKTISALANSAMAAITIVLLIASTRILTPVM